MKAFACVGTRLTTCVTVLRNSICDLADPTVRHRGGAIHHTRVCWQSEHILHSQNYLRGVLCLIWQSTSRSRLGLYSFRAIFHRVFLGRRLPRSISLVNYVR